MRAGADQSLFGPGASRQDSRGAAVCELRGSPRLGSLPRSARALLRTPSASARSGTLSRRAGAKAGGTGRIETARGVAGTRTMAGELRSALGGADSPARKAERHAPDDSGANPDKAARTRASASGSAGGGDSGMFGCCRDPASGGSRFTRPRARHAHRVGRAFTLRASLAGDDRLRRVARPGGGAMNAQSAAALEAATIRQQCKVLRMPTIAAQCAQLAEQAVRERRTHLGYLEALLQAELEERERRLI